VAVPTVVVVELVAVVVWRVVLEEALPLRLPRILELRREMQQHSKGLLKALVAEVEEPGVA
jgi:hypothetical protein